MGLVAELTNKDRPEVILGIDASTKSVAFGVFVSGTCVHYGKIMLDDPSIEVSCGDANKAIHTLIKEYKPNLLIIEKAVFVNNTAVAIKLGNIFGAIIGVAAAQGISCSQVSPFDWLRHIGNDVKSNAATIKLMKEETPGKSKAWYKQKIRLERKQVTINWVKNEHDIDIDDDDIADAIAVGDYGYHVLSAR